MSDTPPFHEDFFERVVDVKWETEPEVYWMIGSGVPSITNGMPMGDTRAWMWTSDNGKKWKGQNLGIRPVQQGFGVLYAGCWMREGLQEGAAPVWVMGGGTSRLVCTSAMGSSTDGKTFGNMASMDETHAIEFVYMGSGGITAASLFTMGFPYSHYDYFNSSDGQTWTPDNFHGGDHSGALMVEPAANMVTGFANAVEPVAMPRATVGSIVRILTTEQSLLLPDRKLVAARGAVTPLNSPELFATGAQSKGDKMVYNACGSYATGLVRTGPLKGHRLAISIVPYHYYPTGGDHGDSTVMVYDLTAGQQIKSNDDKEDDDPNKGLFDVGMARSIAIGYGHYTFVVVGSSSDGSGHDYQHSTISWSTTGLDWKKVELGKHAQINVIAVGPRPTTDKPTKNPIEEPPPPPPAPPSGPKPQPPNPSSPEVS